MQEICFIIERQVLKNKVEDNIACCRSSFWEVDVVDTEARIGVICSGKQRSQSVNNGRLSDIVRADDDV